MCLALFEMSFIYVKASSKHLCNKFLDRQFRFQYHGIFGRVLFIKFSRWLSSTAFIRSTVGHRPVWALVHHAPTSRLVDFTFFARMIIPFSAYDVPLKCFRSPFEQLRTCLYIFIISRTYTKVYKILFDFSEKMPMSNLYKMQILTKKIVLQL